MISNPSSFLFQEYSKDPDDPLSNSVSFVTNATSESTIYEVLDKDAGLTQLEPVTFEVGDTIYWSSQRKKLNWKRQSELQQRPDHFVIL